MNIYFSCSLTGGREDQRAYDAIVQHLVSRGHDVPTAHLADEGIMEVEAVIDPYEVYERDVRWMNECEALIAEVTTPSHGVGYEIAYALGIGRPVLCLHRRGVPVSKMILGNDSPGLTVADYASEREALGLIDEFIVAAAGDKRPDSARA